MLCGMACLTVGCSYPFSICFFITTFAAHEKEVEKLQARIPAMTLAMFDLGAQTDKQLRVLKLEYVNFLGKCLGSKAFLSGVRALERKNKASDAGGNEGQAEGASETVAQLQVCSKIM